MYRYDEGDRGPGGAAPATIAACRTGPTARATSASSTSRPAISLIALNAKTGEPIRAFGKDGIVDLFDELDTTRPRDGADRRQLTADDRQGRGGRRQRAAGRRTGRDRRNVPRPRARLRRADRQAAVDLPHHSRGPASSATTPGRTTRGATPATPASGRRCRPTRSSATSTCRSRRRPTTIYGGHRPGNNLFAESLVCLDARDRQARLALPVRAPRHLGLRHRRRRRSCSTSPSTASRSRRSRR